MPQNNLTLSDIQEIEHQIGQELSLAQRAQLLKEYQRVVTDKAEDWSEIVEQLIRQSSQSDPVRGLD